jgi:hypothetical protein
MFNIIEHMSLRELQSLINAPSLGADDLMKCALGVKTAEVEAYCALSGLGKTTVQEIAERLARAQICLPGCASGKAQGFDKDDA